ncbi:unnamed protein product [Lactuca virosa]|uniref:SWIM-type domain-containing protein n=1 Tax=Lactuca virosa TaxID=75947 RepID=A0AAU9NJ92_9ASTR|nr:unnamed protein product [Lactuca virosa]
MANPDPIFLKMHLHYNGVFTRHPRRYTGGDTFMFTDHDFSRMDLHGCCEFLERFVGEPLEKLYYSARDQTMANGLTVIANEMDYQLFIDVAYQAPEKPIDMYLDHIGEGFEDWFDEESDESGSVIQGDNKEPSQGIHNPEPAYMFDVGLEDEINGEYCTPLNKTKDDEFLNKLCPEGGEEKMFEEMDNSEELDNDVLEEHHIFNPQVFPSGLNQFETRSGNEAYDVDLDTRTCSCRMWQLNGYGCVHSMAAISYLNRDVEKYIDPYFCREMYMKTYQYKIFPMNGSKMWLETNYIPHLPPPPPPPKNRRMLGRPKTKRVRDVSEKGGNHRVSKKGEKISCSLCKVEGHNNKTCPNVDRSRPNKLPTRVNMSKTTKGENVKKMTAEVASGSRTGMEGGDTHGSRGENVKKRIAEVASGSRTRMEGGDTQGTRESGTTHVTRERGNVVIPQVKRRKKSEGIIKKKLSTQVTGKNGEGNTSEKPVNLM